MCFLLKQLCHSHEIHLKLFYFSSFSRNEYMKHEFLNKESKCWNMCLILLPWSSIACSSLNYGMRDPQPLQLQIAMGKKSWRKRRVDVILLCKVSSNVWRHTFKLRYAGLFFSDYLRSCWTRKQWEISDLASISPTFYEQLFLQISFCQKITNINCKYRKVAQNTFVWKSCL